MCLPAPLACFRQSLRSSMVPLSPVRWCRVPEGGVFHSRRTISGIAPRSSEPLVAPCLAASYTRHHWGDWRRCRNEIRNRAIFSGSLPMDENLPLPMSNEEHRGRESRFRWPNVMRSGARRVGDRRGRLDGVRLVRATASHQRTRGSLRSRRKSRAIGAASGARLKEAESKNAKIAQQQRDLAIDKLNTLAYDVVKREWREAGSAGSGATTASDCLGRFAAVSQVASIVRVPSGTARWRACNRK